MTKTMLALSLTSLLLAGCVSTTLTNLTATTQPRNPTGLYRVEYQWDSTQQTIRPATIKPQVIVGYDTYEMKSVLHLTNRWEALIPVNAIENSVNYKFKVEYEVRQFGKPTRASKLSDEYKLIIR